MADFLCKRILIKLSGEALLGSKSSGIDSEIARSIGREIKAIMEMGVDVAIVVGGGNIYRGMNNSGEEGIKQETGHFMGMLATCINCMALSDIFDEPDRRSDQDPLDPGADRNAFHKAKLRGQLLHTRPPISLSSSYPIASQ
jgi:hypothetical protein